LAEPHWEGGSKGVPRNDSRKARLLDSRTRSATRLLAILAASDDLRLSVGECRRVGSFAQANAPRPGREEPEQR
jgi:hypothetical protein